MAAPSGWAQVRQQVRAQETQTESLFHTYSRFAAAADLPPNPTEDELRTVESINESLEKRSAQLQQLSRLLDSEPTPSALKSTNLARHREILQQHRTELSRLKGQIKEKRDRAKLMSNVRADIDAYRARENPGAAEAEYMLRERDRLDRSHHVMDSVLSQAYATNESFALQRESLVGIQRRIVGAAAQIPGINGLMQKIGNKKRRDGVILGSFIALCLLVFIWLW
ncbi:V-snare-domain-containing protein [Piedraia hortae CBS 480.64]|uniref:Golgi SNAP receptor complex member 1 n=1 Tax=Piedraia hortae CBS 480.64 TaxID=1314780 RepID=A0A6A7C763_9PEZI|nr:V-snare-domain-containing protein [Piedraia hortae CBS 480.64]